jgi:2-iminobutanoate/2-iminopropanoate deaminase
MADSDREVVIPRGGAAPIGPYSSGIRAGKHLFASGTTGVDPEAGGLVDEAGGASLRSVLKTTVFMTDLSHFSVMNEVYASYFDEDPPARSTIQVAALPGGASIEIEAIALVVS